MQVSEQQVQAFFRYLEEQRATSESIANLLKRLEGLFANPTAYNWYALDDSPKTFLPLHTIEYAIIDNTNGTVAANLYRGAGVSAYPDMTVAAGQRKVARIAKTRSVTVTGTVGKVGICLSAQPIDQEAESVIATLAGNLAPRPYIDPPLQIAVPIIAASGTWTSPAITQVAGYVGVSASGTMNAADTGTAILANIFGGNTTTSVNSGAASRYLIMNNLIPEGPNVFLQVTNASATTPTQPFTMYVVGF